MLAPLWPYGLESCLIDMSTLLRTLLLCHSTQSFLGPRDQFVFKHLHVIPSVDLHLFVDEHKWAFATMSDACPNHDGFGFLSSGDYALVSGWLILRPNSVILRIRGLKKSQIKDKTKQLTCLAFRPITQRVDVCRH